MSIESVQFVELVRQTHGQLKQAATMRLYCRRCRSLRWHTLRRVADGQTLAVCQGCGQGRDIDRCATNCPCDA